MNKLTQEELNIFKYAYALINSLSKREYTTYKCYGINVNIAINYSRSCASLVRKGFMKPDGTLKRKGVEIKEMMDSVDKL